jgi:hypothetical protein
VDQFALKASWHPCPTHPSFCQEPPSKCCVAHHCDSGNMPTPLIWSVTPKANECNHLTASHLLLKRLQRCHRLEVRCQRKSKVVRWAQRCGTRLRRHLGAQRRARISTTLGIGMMCGTLAPVAPRSTACYRRATAHMRVVIEAASRNSSAPDIDDPGDGTT